MDEIIIPFMSEQEIKENYKNIKPILKKDNKYYLLHELIESELFNGALNWFEREDMKDIELDISTLYIIKDIDMLGKCFIGGPIAPTVAEIITQISKNILCSVSFFEVLRSKDKQDDYMLHLEELRDRFNVSTIRLYSIKKD